MKGPRIRARAALLLLLALPMACTNWKVIDHPSPAEYVRGEKPGTIRITRTDSTQVVLQSPEVVSDTVVGTSAAGGQPSRSAVPVTDIRTLEARVGNSGGTLAIFGGVMLVLAAIVAVSTALSGDWFSN